MTQGKNDGQSLTIGEVLQEIRWLLEATPKGDWVWMHQKFEDDEENDISESEAMLGWVFENLAYGEEGQLHGVQLASTGQLVALTGNGPNSRRHARLLMLTHAALPLILQMLEEAGSLPLPSDDPDWRPISAPCDDCGSCARDDNGERVHVDGCPQRRATVTPIRPEGE